MNGDEEMKDENEVGKSIANEGEEEDNMSISTEEIWREREEALLFEDEEGFDLDI